MIKLDCMPSWGKRERLRKFLYDITLPNSLEGEGGKGGEIARCFCMNPLYEAPQYEA